MQKLSKATQTKLTAFATRATEYGLLCADRTGSVLDDAHKSYEEAYNTLFCRLLSLEKQNKKLRDERPHRFNLRPRHIG